MSNSTPFLLDRIHQRLLFGEVTEDGVGVGLGYRDRGDAFIAEVKDVTFIFLA